ncbi:N-ethylmaleimide reductase [Streptosporangium becharense]|uniref:N-ethylmaleimide reductase n=1 Tax=Streptosporangium becharense TaxID=1816182 RepID=A0A7W9IF28_9ACTN|nr:alkene reductase [Streptosporangium becharense]MBB2909486.1 N-ethylmaleimide reductase [Streptosporangium becharense]MBB5819557.1 N-ethylmaleimide reductase [Streptosporangium becharense]
MPFSTYKLGDLRLPNRIVMAPMTRSRAYVDGIPSSLTALYYAQRASAGLIVTEGVQPSQAGKGYMDTPGLHTDEQVAGWRVVTDAVHAAGGRIFAQVMHAGRIGHPANTGALPVGPSAVQAAGQIFTPEGMQDLPEPLELSTAEIETTVQDFADAAARAIEAGFDGVELHGANGYLVHQFLSQNANLRDDRYGGSVENRIRFAVEIARAVVDRIGAERVGIRLSPGNGAQDLVEDDMHEVYPALVSALADLGLTYLHLVASPSDDLNREIRKSWPTTLIVNDPSIADPAARLAHWLERDADLVALGTAFLANPDLPVRLLLGAELGQPDFATAFGGDHRGYTDYPTLAVHTA